MPDLKFEIISSEVKPYAVMPSLSFKLQITNQYRRRRSICCSFKMPGNDRSRQTYLQ